MQAPFLPPRTLWLILAGGSAGLVIASLVLTAWQNLHPCHLCIFQRLLYMMLAVVGLAAGLLHPRPAGRWLGFFSLPLAAWGLGVAVHQSWLQMQPPGSVSCVGGNPGLIEQVVEWLSEISPELFLATGFCEQAELTILGLTLAQWSVFGFAACLFLAYRAWRPARERRIFRT